MRWIVAIAALIGAWTLAADGLARYERYLAYEARV